MIINDKDALSRLGSPMNLINKLKSSNSNDKRNNAMSLFGLRPDGKKIEAKLIETSTFNPFQVFETHPPQESTTNQIQSLQPLVAIPSSQPSATLDDILDNHDSQIKLGLAHDNALALLNRSVDALSLKLDDVKADRLPQVISAANKVVEGIRRERNEASKNGKDKEVHYHFYTPIQKQVSDYKVIDVGGV